MLDLIRFTIHYGLHFLAPGIIAYVFFKPQWKKVWLIFIVTMIIDLDHLLAIPVFDPNRCSIQYHPLHSTPALILYFALLFHKKTRIFAIALLFHLCTDWLDCLWIK